MKDQHRKYLWILILLIAASPWYLFWSFLAALALLAMILIPGSFIGLAIFITWWRAWQKAQKENVQ